MRLFRRIIILAVAALVAVMMTATPVVAAEVGEEGEKCEEALQELAKAKGAKEIAKAEEEVAEHCPPIG